MPPALIPIVTVIGLQIALLLGGVALTETTFEWNGLGFVLAPVFARLDFSRLSGSHGNFGAQQAPSALHSLGTTVGGFVVICDGDYAFPTLPLAMVVSIVISGGRSNLVDGVLAAAISITVVFIPQYFRVMRAETLRIKAEAFIESANVIGSRTNPIMFRHIPRNATHTLPLILTLNASEAILTPAGLGFLGFGSEPPPAAEWRYDRNKSISGVTSGIWWTSVFPGIAIVGESGSGKSVTAKSILGLLPQTAASSGVVLLGSGNIVTIDQRGLRELRGTRVALVVQEPSTALNPVFPIGWQMAKGLRAHGRVTRTAARARAIEILGRVGIPDAAHRVEHYPHQFSGGQKQRVVIALALVLEAELIVADEPTTALDVTVQAEILELLRRARDASNPAVLLITRTMGVVADLADLADRVAGMCEGTVVEEADATNLFENPQHEYPQRLLAAVPSRTSGVAPTRARAVERSQTSATAALVVATELVIQYPGRFGCSGFRTTNSISFEIGAGEVRGLVGESGSGERTIGRAIAGPTSVTGGSLTVVGQHMLRGKGRKLRPLRRQIGLIFQDSARSFNPLWTIARCIAEPLIVQEREPSAATARRRVDELLEAVQLPRAFGDRYPHELSGGQRQRASLARALELFADRPKEFGFAALLISHDLAVVDFLADRIAVLQHRELVEGGTGAQVLGAPSHPFTQRLLASLPVPNPAEQALRRHRLEELRNGDRRWR